MKTQKKLSRYTRMLRSIRESLKQAKETAKQGSEVLAAIRPILDTLPEEIADPQIYRWGNKIDFNYLSHENTVKVIQAFGGKFRKDYNEDSINYTSESPIKVGDVAWHVRVFAGKPPPNCKLVECGEEFVPGYVKKKFKIQCEPGSEQSGEAVMGDASAGNSQAATADGSASSEDTGLPSLGASIKGV